MLWLVEILGPQHAGKTTIAELLSLLLEENGIPSLRVETDNYVYNFFPIYTKLKATGQNQKAHDFLSKRWNLINDIISATIRKGLQNGVTVIHDHLNTGTYKRGVDQKIAKETNAEYFSVFVTAPLESLKERWSQCTIPDGKVEQLEKTYIHLQALRQEFPFRMTVDTSVMPAEEAAGKIVSAIYPNINVQVIASSTLKVEGPQNLKNAKPHLLAENIQLIRIKDSYVIVHNHRRYITDETGLKILSLCDGKNSVKKIADKARTDLDTARKTIAFLYQSKMIRM